MVIVQLCVVMVAFALGVLLLSSRQTRATHVYLAGLAFAIGAWALCWLLYEHHVAPLQGLVFGKLSLITALLVPLACYYFSLTYPYRRAFSHRRFMPLLALAAGAISVIIAAESVVWIVSNSVPGAAARDVLVWAYCVIYGIVYLFAVSNVLHNYNVARRNGVRDTARYVAIVAALLGAGFVGLAVAAGGVLLFKSYTLIWLVPVLLMGCVIGIFYVLVRQGIFDVRSAVARSAAYAIVVGVTLSLYAGLLFSMSDLIFHRDPPGTFQLLFYIAMALVLLVSLRPLQLLIDRLTHTVFYQSEYQVDETLHKLAQVTANEIELRRIVKGSLDVLYGALHPVYASLYILSAEGKTYHFGRTEQARLHREHRRQLRLVSQVIDELPQIVRRSDIISLEERRVMDKADAAIVVKLVVQGEHVGVLFLGERRSGMSYGDKDMQLLHMAATELALAIQNGLRFEEVQQFNKRLRREVTNATQQLRRSNRQLHRLDEAKDEFLSIASHQLRTPLTSVKGYLSMLLDGDAGELSEQQRSLAEEAFTSSQRMVGLIEDFLNLSRLQTGRFSVEKEKVDMTALVQEEIATLEGVAAARGIQLKAIIATDIPQVLLLDEGKIRQVIMNFIDNALYYTRAKSTVTIRLSREAGQIRLVVQDKGIGVPAKEQARLFTKFYRASNARKQRPDGTGVGLYLAKKVIIEHGGEMIVRSIEGEGSTFGFTLPISEVLPAKEDTQQLEEN